MGSVNVNIEALLVFERFQFVAAIGALHIFRRTVHHFDVTV